MKTEENTQCKYFVERKKRLCRMTVRPGKEYCGEHEPNPLNETGEPDIRIPCPLDPKHTCYASKLQKHVQVCNARPGDVPEYVVHNTNAPTCDSAVPARIPLGQVPKDDLSKLISKINRLYEEVVSREISSVAERDIHPVVVPEFSEPERTESSRRHLRQVSALLHLAEDEGLVRDGTCYVELGAGKGQLSYYMCVSWCGCESDSSTLAVDRAALRHKRDNKVAAASRVRVDLRHLALHAVPAVRRSGAVLGLAKHLCGAATDYALRCMTTVELATKSRGVVLATCCHHRCDLDSYVAREHLQELGISGEELNTMLGVVSWATCGGWGGAGGEGGARGEAGRRAKLLLDWGRVLYLRGRGLRARLCHYVPASVSLENVCIVAKETT